MNELEVKMSKYGQFPRHELISMGLLSPFTKRSQNLKSKNNSQQGNPLSDKCISPDANFVETHQAADISQNLKTTEDKK